MGSIHMFGKSILMPREPKNPKKKDEMHQTVGDMLLLGSVKKISDFIKEGKAIKVYGYSEKTEMTNEGKVVSAAFYLEELDGN